MRVKPLGYLNQVLPEEGRVAQLVERWIEDPSVGGSTPSLSTNAQDDRGGRLVCKTHGVSSILTLSSSRCPYVGLGIRVILRK